MVKDTIVIYRKNEAILILISSKRYFNQYLTKVFLNFKEALLFWTLVPFSDMPAFTVQLYYTRIPGLFIQICVFVKSSGLLQIHHYAYM